jgi:hypothetical protein
MTTKDTRKFPRHPTDIPIEVQELSLSPSHCHQLKDISFGGLAFVSSIHLEQGTIVGVRILTEPVYEMIGKVRWCRENQENQEYFDVGIAFMGKSDATREQMVETVQQIEDYLDRFSHLLTDVIVDVNGEMVREV